MNRLIWHESDLRNVLNAAAQAGALASEGKPLDYAYGWLDAMRQIALSLGMSDLILPAHQSVSTSAAPSAPLRFSGEVPVRACPSTLPETTVRPADGGNRKLITGSSPLTK
jgi:hypothetical protein